MTLPRCIVNQRLPEAGMGKGGDSGKRGKVEDTQGEESRDYWAV